MLVFSPTFTITSLLFFLTVIVFDFVSIAVTFPVTCLDFKEDEWDVAAKVMTETREIKTIEILFNLTPP